MPVFVEKRLRFTIFIYKNGVSTHTHTHTYTLHNIIFLKLIRLVLNAPTVMDLFLTKKQKRFSSMIFCLSPRKYCTTGNVKNMKEKYFSVHKNPYIRPG